MSEMGVEEKTGITLPFAGGYDAPKMWFQGSVEETKQQIIEATGLDPEAYGNQTLTAVVAEASRWVRGVYTAANELADKPRVVEDRDGVPAVTGGIAAQAKAAQEAAEPEVQDPPVAEFLASQIKAAKSEADLDRLFETYGENGWTEEHTDLVVSRLKELEGETA